jgi:hypothetical protein
MLNEPVFTVASIACNRITNKGALRSPLPKGGVSMRSVLQWILSKIFPYRLEEVIGEDSQNRWDLKKSKELEEFYGGSHETGQKGRWRE